MGMPDVRSMPSIAKGVFEVRIRLTGDAYRVFYLSLSEKGLVIFHAFIKKSQQTPQKEIDTSLQRLRTFLRDVRR